MTDSGQRILEELFGSLSDPELMAYRGWLEDLKYQGQRFSGLNHKEKQLILSLYERMRGLALL
jgi:hypothetical protein